MAKLERRCGSSAIGNFTVESHTNKKKTYDLRITEDGRNTCTCIAFAMKRNKLGGNSAIGNPECTCKHINALLATRNACGWTSVEGEKAKFETVCPRCFHDTEEFDPRDPETIDLDELMQDFLALSKKLKGTNVGS